MLGIGEIRREFSVGRDLATKLAELLPHLTVGRVGVGAKRLVQRADLERVMARATADRMDLCELVRREDARYLLASWLVSGEQN